MPLLEKDWGWVNREWRGGGGGEMEAVKRHAFINCRINLSTYLLSHVVARPTC